MIIGRKDRERVRALHERLKLDNMFEAKLLAENKELVSKQKDYHKEVLKNSKAVEVLLAKLYAGDDEKMKMYEEAINENMELKEDKERLFKQIDELDREYNRLYHDIFD